MNMPRYHSSPIAGTGKVLAFRTGTRVPAGLRNRVWMIAELERALELDRLVLHYQPQYDINTQRVVGVEALVRLVTTSGTLIGPDQFIKLAEESGQILQLGRWVMEEACQQLGRWQRAGRTGLRMAVNISPRQLLDRDFTDVVDAAVRRAGIRHSDLELEITETAAMADPAWPITMMAVRTGPISRIRVRATRAPRSPSEPNLTRV